MVSRSVGWSVGGVFSEPLSQPKRLLSTGAPTAYEADLPQPLVRAVPAGRATVSYTVWGGSIPPGGTHLNSAKIGLETIRAKGRVGSQEPLDR